MKTLKNIQLWFGAALIFLSGTLSAHWTTKGPYGGKVKCMAVADTMIYIGTFDGGVYRSTNSFITSWRYINYTGLSDAGINALTSIGSKVIAGTVSGIFRSKDIGNTWSLQNSGLTNINVLSLIRSNQFIFAGTNGSGVFISTDSAATWLPANTGISSQTITALAVDGNTLYAGTNGGGVYISTNNGALWTAVNTGLSNQVIKTLAVSGTSIFAGTSTGVFVSPTSAISWNMTNTGLTNTTINCLFAAGGMIYAATNGGVFISPDSSPSWSAGNTGYTDSTNAVLVFNNKLYAGTNSDGIIKSASVASPNWTKSNTGFNNLIAYTIYNSGQLVIAATNKGFFVSRDLAATYVSSNTGLTDSLHVNCLTISGTKLYVGTMFGGVFMSPDTGKTWTQINTGLGTMNIKKIITSANNIIAAGSNGDVYTTLQSSINWGLTTGLPGSLNITSLATDGTNIFLGTSGSGVYLSTNAASWSAANIGLSNMNVTSLAIKGSDIYAGTNGGGIYKSTSSAVSWSAVNSGLPTLTITSLCAANQWIVAGYKGGVHSTFDDGISWMPTNVELYIPSYSDVTNISFTSASTRVFIGTPHNSLYSNATSELAVGIKEYEYAIGKVNVYPNPNNAQFNISFKNLKANVNEVSIYDQMGKLIHHLEIKNENDLSLQLKVSEGIYFVKVNTDKGSVTEKLVVQY